MLADRETSLAILAAWDTTPDAQIAAYEEDVIVDTDDAMELAIAHARAGWWT